MKNIEKALNKFGIHLPTILIPNNSIDKKKWAVIACDQYSSQSDYWDNVSNFVKDAPSTLHIIYPECYLNKDNEDQRIKEINANMERYLNESIFKSIADSFIFVKRTLRSGKVRSGLICAIDLDKYDFNKDSTSPIRATEGTIVERIPPRLKIRKDAPLELPHVMVLVDDKAAPLIAPFNDYIKDKEPLYTTDLMQESGKITGYQINDKKLLKNFLSSLKIVANKKNFKQKYNTNDLLLFAIGDGNHSLATAKSNWEILKKELNKKEQKNHPAKYALIELNSIYDLGIEFEPIHRVLFDCDYNTFLKDFTNQFDTQISTFNKDETTSFALSIVKEQQFLLIHQGSVSHIKINNPSTSLTVGTVQQFIDDWLKKNNAKIDFIHGVEASFELSNNKNNFAIVLPNISKDDFFKTVVKDGSFPRKTFSMGEAHEKRFYYEARKIK